VRGTFNLDQFLPQAFHPEQALSYDNLIYCCAACNAGKGGQRIPNPEKVLTAGDVWVNEDGTIATRTAAAQRVVRKLGLDAPEYTEFRLLWINILALAEQYNDDLYRKLLGYPADRRTSRRCGHPATTAGRKGCSSAASPSARRGRCRKPTELSISLRRILHQLFHAVRVLCVPLLHRLRNVLGSDPRESSLAKRFGKFFGLLVLWNIGHGLAPFVLSSVAASACYGTSLPIETPSATASFSMFTREMFRWPRSTLLT